ncbi:hypothetical protein CAPTEDRAFT_187263 [Capitella teleta]|uniref:Uncharacterized protein n=1 Tax=Capitella teleta TaxID=283909 RepID=X1ZK32_CAPTE|nr:hypothetical protein CAPTEDRAFT_187263 [Capitella teleta]|eukprot:ELU10102.1 hypothetical protein CAPTEDRAFT_187263 [Capitella teleta]
MCALKRRFSCVAWTPCCTIRRPLTSPSRALVGFQDQFFIGNAMLHIYNSEELCRSGHVGRYWPGHLHLLKADSTASCKLLQMLLLQLADEELLFRDFPVQSGDDWLKLVQLRKLQTFSNGSPNCLKCKSPLQMIADPCVVPWEALARRAMKSLGVLRGWGLLKDTEMPAHLLSGEFFHEVVQANAAEHKQSQLLEDLLRDFEADHTCRQPATIPPQVLMAARLEISSSNKDVATSMLINSLLSCLHSKEKSTGHWSSSLDISRSQFPPVLCFNRNMYNLL